MESNWTWHLVWLGLTSLWEDDGHGFSRLLASPFLFYFGRRPVVVNRLNNIGQARIIHLPSMADEPYQHGLAFFRNTPHFPYGFGVVPAGPVPLVWTPYPFPWL